MRIEDRQLTGTQAQQTGRPGEAKELAGVGGSRHRDVVAGSFGDRVELSDLTGGLARALEASAAAIAERAAELERTVADGTYRPEARSISRAMLAEMAAVGDYSFDGTQSIQAQSPR
jgi:hypothetical protein